MSKINLTDVQSGYNISAIRENFNKIENELNNKVLYRENPSGEPNSLVTNLDANGRRIYNLPQPLSPNEPARLIDLEYSALAAINAQASADAAAISAEEAQDSASFAASSAVAASASVVAADASKDAAAISATAAYDNSRLTAGTVTTGAPGSSASVSINGLPGTQVIDFTIPRGDVGPTGPQGPMGDGDVDGPVSSTDGALAVFNGTTGKLLKQGGNASHTGSLNFSGTGLRLTGDFSNATLANRLLFQTSTVNGNTAISTIPNGTSSVASFNAHNSSDPTNSGLAQMQALSTDIRFNSNIAGTGTYLPMTFYTGSLERMRIDTSGNVLVTGSGGMGYSTGSGGTVTQATSKSTSVTLNKPSGLITLNGAALAANTTVSFTLNNTSISGSDVLIIQIAGGVASAASYNVWASSGAGTATIYFRNITGGSLSEAANIQFSIVRGATS